MTHRQNTIELLESRQLFSADLTGTFLGKVPTALPPQANNHVTVRIANQGDAPAVGSGQVQLFASMDTTLDSSDVLLGTASTKLNLKPAKFANVSVKFLSPSNVNTGSYYLLAQVIPDSKITEANTTNNVFATTAPLTISKPIVDLTDTITLSPKTVSYKVGAKKQVPIKFAVAVTNNGNVPAKGPLAISFFGSEDQTLDVRDTLLLTVMAKPININAAKTKVYNVTFKPAPATRSGTFYVIAQLNPAAPIVESNSDNDSAGTSNRLTLNNPALPAAPRLVGGLTDNIVLVVVGTPEQVTFTATVDDQTSTTAVELDEVDSAGNPISKLADLLDNGSPANGDVTAQDGVFTAIVPISFGSPATRYFVATLTDPTTNSTEHSAALSVIGIAPITPG